MELYPGQQRFTPCNKHILIVSTKMTKTLLHCSFVGPHCLPVPIAHSTRRRSTSEHSKEHSTWPTNSIQPTLRPPQPTTTHAALKWSMQLLRQTRDRTNMRLIGYALAYHWAHTLEDKRGKEGGRGEVFALPSATVRVVACTACMYRGRRYVRGGRLGAAVAVVRACPSTHRAPP